MTRIWLLRHGQTEANVVGRFAGRTAEPLTEEGKKQAIEAGKKLYGQNIKHIYASPLLRTLETAKLIASQLENQVEIIPENAFIEINIPPWEGKQKIEIRRDPQLQYEIWEKTPHLFNLNGCETLQEVFNRAVKGCEKVFEKERGKTSLIVTHMVIVRVILLYYLGLPLSAYRKIPVPNATPILLIKDEKSVNVKAPFDLTKVIHGS